MQTPIDPQVASLAKTVQGKMTEVSSGESSRRWTLVLEIGGTKAGGEWCLVEEVIRRQVEP